jgi:NAD(P)-dependent dehydrogenase (short-subunit alcohol dehydrogenase family)
MSPRHVVVTGGSRGIGRAVVEAFASGGERVVAVGRDEQALDETVSGARSRGGEATARLCDVTEESSVGALFEDLGPVDVLVNNAGIASSAPAHRITLEDWHRHLAVNSTGAFLCTRAVLPGMRELDHGRIVLVASIAALEGRPYTGAYTASKHAAVGFVRTVAAEVAGSGVTANAVCPTYVRTDMTTKSIARIADRTGRSATEARAALVAQSPLGRLLEPEEVASAVVFLASKEAGAINGQTLVMDGGGIQR